MSIPNDTLEKEMEKQRQEIEREKQYHTVTSLGWKSAGIVFLVILIAIVIYAVLIR